MKLENVLLVSQLGAQSAKAGPYVKIADFGLSSFFTPGADVVYDVAGSLQYLAPEIVKQHANSGVAVDTWCLGVLLFVLLTGRLPFDVPDRERRDRVAEIRRRILNVRALAARGVRGE